MKWYQTLAIILAILIVIYMAIKTFAKTNVYTYIEPSLPEPPKGPKPSNCGGTSYLGDQSLPLGFRNNNPLNLIQSSNNWKGKIKNAPGQFEQFCSMEYGTRAAMINLRTYINRYKRNTITKIISKWAPATENDTQAYIEFVSKQAAIRKDQVITFSKQNIFRIVKTMALMENGMGYSLDDLILETAWASL